MQEIYLVSQIVPSCTVHVEDGIIKEVSKPLYNFVGKPFEMLKQTLLMQKNRKFIIEAVEDEANSNGN